MELLKSIVLESFKVVYNLKYEYKRPSVYRPMLQIEKNLQIQLCLVLTPLFIENRVLI